MRHTPWSALFILILSCQAASALEPWRVVVRVEGRVESRQPGQQNWAPIWRSRILTDGDFARTLGQSQARIKLADQSEFAIGADTVVEMSKFELTPEGRTVLFNLQVGEIRARVARAVGKQSRFEVKTPNGVLAARGTDFSVVQSEETTLHVFHGRVDVITARGTHIFREGEGGVIGKDGAIHVHPGLTLPTFAHAQVRTARRAHDSYNPRVFHKLMPPLVTTSMPPKQTSTPSKYKYSR